MNTERKFTVVKQCMIAIGIVINIVGAFLALNLRLPVYLDSICLLYTSPSPRDKRQSRMPSSA